MCGIAGIVDFKNNPHLLESILAVNDEIKHRGPDDEGFTFFKPTTNVCAYGINTPNNVKKSNLAYAPKISIENLQYNYSIVLAHRRLAVIDLSEKAHQPMCNEDENFWITYNGEIYNYQSIKDELTQLGVTFISSSDTEVVLKAYIKWGEKCLDKFNGMWSFVIYDKKKKKIFGARDRFGVKPFYYIKNNNYFAFCSEAKGLLKINQYKKQINPIAVYDYLFYGKIEYDSESFFKNIFELKPATYFILDLSSQQINFTNYYQLKTNTKWKKITHQQTKKYIDEVKSKVLSAISLRLNADVKTGTCLSGGVDSSILVCARKEITQPNISQQEVFTAIYPHTDIDESKWAKKAIENTNSKWHTTSPNADDLKKQLHDIVYTQDFPFNSTSTFSQFEVMKLVNKFHIKVTLDGQGADELFAGYTNHFTSFMLNALSKFSFRTFFKNTKNHHKTFANHKNIIFLTFQHFAIHFFPLIYHYALKIKQPELNFLTHTFTTQYRDRLKLMNDKINFNLNRLLHYQFTTYGLKNLLRTADRNSMRFSVEGRIPFSDDIELITKIFSVSGSYKIQFGKSKYLLREAMKDFLPEEIYKRKDKIGFATPENIWLKELKPYFKKILSETKNDEFVKWENVYENFDKIYDNSLKKGTSRLWRLLNFLIWRKVYDI